MGRPLTRSEVDEDIDFLLDGLRETGLELSVRVCDDKYVILPWAYEPGGAN